MIRRPETAFQWTILIMDGFGKVVREDVVTLAYLEAALSMGGTNLDDFINFWVIQ